MSDTDREFGSASPPPPQPQQSVHVESADPLIGIDLGGFKVTRLIAAGGMGLVYEALHEAIGRRAAVKVLKPEVAADAEWTRRFLSEARALGSLKHRNLIEVLNFGKTPDGREFLMMEFLDGEPLDAYIRRLGQLAPAAALGIADQILNGLAEAHKKGVVHRDLKPSNVYLLREHNGELLVKVLDFGLARQEPVALLDGAIQLARRADGASLLAGTPEYIAPEQAQGKKVGGQADLYSLGVMLFEMLSGQLPFEAESVTTLLQKHLSERPPRLSAVMNNLPEGLEEFVESLLEKEPERRPSSADAARVTVQRLLKRLSQDSTAVRMRPDLPLEDPKRLPTMRIDRPQPGTDKALAAAFPERQRPKWLVPALVLLVLLLLGGVALTQREPAPPPSEPPKVVEAPKVVTPPEPVKQPEVVKPAQTEPSGEELMPLPTNVKPEEPVKVAAKTPEKAPKVRVSVESAACSPTPEWRTRLTKDIAEMGALERVLKDAKLYEVWDSRQGKVSDLVSGAKTLGECVEAEKAYERLRSDLKL
ncbi:MAG: serine/threonine protein kinase [Myxococcota bacterium]